VLALLLLSGSLLLSDDHSTSTLSSLAAWRDVEVVVVVSKARKRDAAADEVKDFLGRALCTCLVEKAFEPPISSNIRLVTLTKATMIPADLMLLVVNIQFDVDSYIAESSRGAAKEVLSKMFTQLLLH
jgi:hypothetical protein